MNKNVDFFKEFMFRDEEGDWFVKPVCDFFMIDYDNQVKRISKDRICQTDTGKKTSESIFNDKIPRLTLQDRGFSRWIQMVNPSIVAGQLREKFEIFQANIFSYLWEGSFIQKNQLEDIRDYTVNINQALRTKQQITEYVTEQKQFRNICLANTPEQWAKIKTSLEPKKALPQGVDKMKALAAALPNDLDELKRMKKNIQTSQFKVRCLLEYQSNSKKAEKNPMPEGYKREVLNVRMREYEKQIEEVNAKIIEISKL